MVEWGPEIAVNGVRPEWLKDDVRCIIRDGDEWLGENWDARARNWNFHVDVTAIRLPADHPYYKQSVSGKDGSSYYDIEINGVTVSCNDVIDALGLNFNRGEAFKALWRAGRKPGTSEKYDLDKAAYFTAREATR